MLIPMKPKRSKPKSVALQANELAEFDTHQAELSRAQISERAYAIYQSRGFVNGRDLQDWLSAEKELRAEGKQDRLRGTKNALSHL